MKQIELTEEHRSKLLEMCKVLFPEYVIYTADNDGFIEGEQWVGDQNMGEDRPVNEFNIHWFEFCMTHLVEKLNNLSDVYEEMPPYVANVYGGANGKWNLYVKFHFHYPKNRYKKHPIDYLYEEFKKLK